MTRTTGAAALALAAALPCCRPSTPEAALPVLFELPAFSLVERSGRPFTREDLRGRVSVADFVFTRCAGVCPAMTGRMARLREALPADVRLVSFTVDPEHDTPAVLRRYAEPLNPGQQWLFVTGGRTELHRLATEGFKLAAMEMPREPPPGGSGAQPRSGVSPRGPRAGIHFRREPPEAEEGPFLHSSKFALLDGQARVRGYYDSDDATRLEALPLHARRLWEEGR